MDYYIENIVYKEVKGPEGITFLIMFNIVVDEWVREVMEIAKNKVGVTRNPQI